MIAIVIAVVGAIVVTVHLLHREPSYQGRHLSDWLKRYYKAGPNSPEEAEAAAAVQAIGTNALPYMLDWIQTRWTWRDWIHTKLPYKVSDNNLVNAWLTTHDIYVIKALTAFQLLGTNAAGAIPELETMIRYPTSESANEAITALGSIREPALPLLKAALDDPNQYWRSRIVWEFRNMVNAGETNTYLPLIVAALNHRDVEVRGAATNALMSIAPHLLTNAPAQ